MDLLTIFFNLINIWTYYYNCDTLSLHARDDKFIVGVNPTRLLRSYIVFAILGTRKVFGIDFVVFHVINMFRCCLVKARKQYIHVMLRNKK